MSEDKGIEEPTVMSKNVEDKYPEKVLVSSKTQDGAEEKDPWKPKEGPKKTGLFGKAHKYVKEMEGDLVMLLFGLTFYMINPFVVNLIKYKTCNMKYPMDMCYPKINTTLVKEIQTEAMDYILQHDLIKSIPPLFLALVLGHWSDLHGRKPVLLMSLTGNAISVCLYLLNYWNTNWPPNYIVYAAIPAGFSGDYTGFMMGLFGWIKDSFPTESLPLKIGIVDGIEMSTTPIAPLLGGSMYDSLGYDAVFIFCIVCLTLAILVTIFLLSDKHIRARTCKNMVLDFVDLRNIKEIFKVMYKKRPANRRLRMLLIYMIIVPNAMGFFVHISVFQNYAEAKLGWDLVTVTYFNGVHGAFSAIGCFVTMPILRKVLNLGPIPIATIGCMGFLAFFLGAAFADTTASMFGIAVFQAIAVVAMVTTRSCALNCVEREEAGKVNSIIAVLFNLSKIASSSYGLLMYKATVKTMPGAFCLVASSFIIISLSVSGILYRVERQALNDEIVEKRNAEKLLIS